MASPEKPSSHLRRGRPSESWGADELSADEAADLAPAGSSSNTPGPVVSALSVVFGLTIPLAAGGLVTCSFLSFVPLLGVVMLPAAVGCLLVLCYSVTALAYARLAQVDPPLTVRTPFFQVGLPRNCLLGLRLVAWGVEFVVLAARLGLQWCIREVVVSRSKEEIVTEPITYAPGCTLTVFRPPTDKNNNNNGSTAGRPVLVLIPPPAIPLPARAKDVILTLVGHQLRFTPAVVVVPSSAAFPAYPSAQLEETVLHARDLLLSWVVQHAAEYGGDPSRIFLVGHGSAGVVAVWSSGVRDAIVESRDSWLLRRWRRLKGLRDEASWQLGDDDGGEADQVERDGVPDLDELDGEGVDEVPNGLKRIVVWGAPDPPPRVEGIILLSAPADIPLQVREEATLYLEHLSYTRRFFGPAHVPCMLASPSHCLYAAKSVLDMHHPLMVRRWLLVHGGKDVIVPPTQAAMMNELLLGLGLTDVYLRAYRDMGHLDSLLALARGAKNRYSSLVMRDIRNFVHPSS